jgi:hypothetical protein
VGLQVARVSVVDGQTFDRWVAELGMDPAQIREALKEAFGPTDIKRLKEYIEFAWDTYLALNAVQ